MRLIVLALPLPMLLLGACIGPTPTPDASVAAPAAFAVPMDPGQIRCAQLSNPTALAEGTSWAVGQARAAVLAGRSSTRPDPAAVSASLARYCVANPDSSLHSAVSQIGV